MSQTKSEQKNRFQVSRELQEEFVNGIAQTMLSLAESAGEWKKPWNTENQPGMPFCPVTGREYGGANMVRLMLTGMVRGYEDDRWLTFNQLQQYKEAHPDSKMKIGKGEKGVKLLRPEEVYFRVDEDNRWTFLTEKEVEEYKALKARGQDMPDVQHKTLFYPFTVFNAQQIENFPLKEAQGSRMSDVERHEFLERFIACSGVKVEHHDGDPSFNHQTNTVRMPHPDRFTGTEEYYAAKLHEFFHATGHESREDRQRHSGQTIKSYAFEEMRAEMFSMLAGAKLALPMPESNSSAYIRLWNQTFSGGEVRAVFQAASEAGKMLSVLHQFQMGEEPKPRWFPPRSDWQALMEQQKERDAQCGVSFSDKAHAQSPGLQRAAPPSFMEAADAFRETDDLAVKARAILQNPDFLAVAMKMDPKSITELASLCDQMGTVLQMELDEHRRAANSNADKAAPLHEQQNSSGQSMRG